MERGPAVLWICLLGAGLAMALPPAVAVTTSEADPRPPRLIGCVFLHRANVTCRWEAGDTPKTNYTLQVHLVLVPSDVCTRQSSFSPDNGAASFLSAKMFTCTTSGTSCTAQFISTCVRNCFCIIITSHGRNQSIPRCQSGRTEVMLPPVLLNSVKAVSGRPECLNVTWSYLLDHFPLSKNDIEAGDLKSQIQFTAQEQSDAQVETVIVNDTSFLVCLFRPDTSYTVRLRHHYRGPESPWSPWSNAREGKTGEDAPSAAPAFWRRVKQTDKNGWRLISLLWKPLPRFLANGRVLFFNVTCQTESAKVLNDHMSCRGLHHTSTSCSVLLPAGRCSCALTASTSAGTSPEARIWLSGASETEPPPPSQITVNPLGDSRLDVRWTAPVDWSASGFVVEWFAVREKNSSILHWEKLNSSRTALVITEGVKPMERYAVSVKALYGERGAGRNRTVHNYTRQGAPSAGPKVEVQQISGGRVDLRWSPVPVELLHGFIRNYTIFYTTANQSARGVIVPGHALHYSLDGLSPGNYDIFMQANTDAGAGAAGPIANVHIGAEETSIVTYAILPVILTSLALVLMTCLSQSRMVKQKLPCQDIPDPSNSSLAHWTPKITLESMKRPGIAERTEIKYSEVFLLGVSELQNSDPDQDLSYQSNLQADFSHCFSPLPVSGLQTSPNTRKSEKKCSTRAKTTSYIDLSSVYSNVLFSQTLKSLPSPLILSSDLQSNDWQHCSVCVNDVKLQLGRDSEPSGSLQGRSTIRSDSQTDELKNFQHQSPVSISDFSSFSPFPYLLSHPAEVTSPQHPFSQSLYNSAPSLQPDTFTRPEDTFTSTAFSPFSHSVYVVSSLCPEECDPYISAAV
ncbi:interleukin-6 receptor subunit beta isoform X2 [Sebastes fasciatus]|uniref:interleukin-6 receptor subunit beta isoform X2 n=1 Tax=Sebastes fasciatus TaxID=394691 RepID=UPI003D9F743A